MPSKVRFNKRSVTTKIDKALEGAEQEGKDYLLNIANQFADETLNFTDTGAYASSFSVTEAGGRAARRTSSKNRPQNQDRGIYRNVALSLMTADINSLEVLDAGRIIFRNAAPHAPEVERKYDVFSKVRNRSF